MLIQHHVSAWEDIIRETKNNGDTAFTACDKSGGI